MAVAAGFPKRARNLEKLRRAVNDRRYADAGAPASKRWW